MMDFDELYQRHTDYDDPQPAPTPDQLEQEQRWERISFGVAILALVALLVGASL